MAQGGTGNFGGYFLPIWPWAESVALFHKQRLFARRPLCEMGNQSWGGKLAGGAEDALDFSRVDEIDGIHGRWFQNLHTLAQGASV